MSERRRRRAGRAGLIVLLVVGGGLRLWPVEHGLPRNHLVDAHIVNCALGMAADRDLVPPQGRYSTYPYLMPYLLLPVYGLQYAVGRASGAWDDAKGFGDVLLQHPERARLPARLLVLLLGTATIAAVFAGLRATGLRAGAWVGSWLVASSTLHVQFSIQERPWVPLVLFGALSAGCAVRYRRRQRLPWLAGSALMAGLAFATHQVGLVLFGLPLLAWLATDRPWRRWRHLLLASLGFVVSALLTGHAYLLRYGLGPGAGVIQGQSYPVLDVNIGGQGALLQPSLASLAPMLTAFVGYEPVLTLLALSGLGWALKERRTRWLVLYALLHGAFFLTYPDAQPRYLLPLVVLLAWPAGLAAERALARPSLRVVVVLLLAVPLVQSLRLGWVLARADTRVAGEQLAASLPPGSVLGIDHFGPQVELDTVALERLARLRPLRLREAHRLRQLASGVTLPAGVDAIRLEDLFYDDPREELYRVRPEVRRWGVEPAEVLAALGVTHVLVADRRPGERRPGRLASIVATARRTQVIDPAGAGARADEALLPLEMARPLVAAWQVERPGPRLSLYALP